MRWIADTLRAYPEIALFATLALGYALGRLRIGPVQLNPIIGVLVAGLLIGQIGVVVPAPLQRAFFMLFLFSIGYSIGPQFFAGLRASGAKQAALAVFFCVVSIGVALLLAQAFGMSAGAAAGLFAGGLNVSAVLGTAGDAITNLGIDEALRSRLLADVTIAFAVAYIPGLIATVWAIAWLGPRLMRTDVAAECRRLEAELGVTATEPGILSAYQPFIARAYAVPRELVGSTIAALESRFAPQRVFVERLRRAGGVQEALPDTALEAGDCVVLSGRHEALAGAGNPLRDAEVHDAGLLDLPAVQVDVVLTRRDLAGSSLGVIAGTVDREVSIRGVFVRRLTRLGEELPQALGTVLERGDVLTLIGEKARVERVASRIGIAEWPGVASDLLTVTATVAVGAVIGLLSVPVAGVEVGLSVAVGVLLGGLVVGWLRAVLPVFGRVRRSGLWVLSSLGLTAFLGAVVLDAAPEFVRGVRESGVLLLACGLTLGSVPHVLTILIARYVLRIHPGIALGIVAGAGTAPAALVALEGLARSKVPMLGYGVSYAVGSILLTLGGTVIVAVLAL